MNKRTIGSLSVAMAAALWLSGCGAGEGGANTQTKTTLKPSTSGPAANGAAANGTAPAASGAAPAAGGGGGVGTWVGKVVFEGTPPNLPPKVQQGDQSARDAAVCAAETIPDQSLLVKDGGLANVFIYLEKAPAGAQIPAPPTEANIFDQKNCVFIPHALLVRIGQELRVLSGDPIAHNTHTFPKRNPGFNSVIPPDDRAGTPLVYKDSEREPVEVKCDLHAWMIAYHLPLDHPFAAVSGEGGTFRIEGLPAGKHAFKVWHERAGILERKLEVTITADQETTQDLKYGAEKFAYFNGPEPKSIMLSANDLDK